MSFVYPAGLWALLALGVFAAVCLIRHRSEVTPVSSTYLWRLSEQRRKKKGYWRTLKRSLFFALQFLALTLSALLIAQPIMPMPGSGVNVAVILDASASMQMADGSGQTRFARAVAAAERDMDRLPWGASVTVVLAGDEARVAADHVSGGAELRAALEGVSCGWGAGDVAGAAALCQQMLDEGGISDVRLYTDAPYAQAEGLEVVSLCGEDEWNVSLGALETSGSIYGTAFETTVQSFGRSADVSFELIVDGKARGAEEIDLRVNGQKQTAQTVYCPEGEAQSVSLLLRQVYDFTDASVRVCAEDGMAQVYSLYGQITEITDEYLMLEGTEQGKVQVNLLDDTLYNGAIQQSELAVGQYAEVLYDGKLTRSIPAQAAALAVNVYPLTGTVDEVQEDGRVLVTPTDGGAQVLLSLPEGTTVAVGETATFYTTGVATMSIPAQMNAIGVEKAEN